MAKDVRIVPADSEITFYNTVGSASGYISLTNDDIVIGNQIGDVVFGDASSDVYIGDGVNNVDIVFEQNGSIRAEDGSGANITLGSPGTAIYLTGSVYYNGIPSIGVNPPTTLTKNGSNVFVIDLSTNTNFILSATGAYTLSVTATSGSVGQSGSFIIRNTGTTTPGALPSNLKTPGGRTISWQTDSGDVSVLSYLVVDTGTIIVNYIGDFG